MKNRIKELREKRGMTQEQLGEMGRDLQAGDQCHRDGEV